MLRSLKLSYLFDIFKYDSSVIYQLSFKNTFN